MTDGSTAGPAVESPAGGGEGVRDTRHVLTEVERAWCTELRAALKAQGVPEPEPRCDFTLAQFALVGKGKTAKTVKRIQKYNRLITKEYGYSGAHAAVGTPAFGTANRKFPGFLHMVSPQTDNKAPTLVADVGCYCPRELDESKGEVRDIMVDYLIALDALTADLDDIRKGVCFAQQCSGMGMSNYSHSVEKEAAKIYQDSYPAKYNLLPCVNIGLFFRVIIRFTKLFMSKKLQDRLVTCSEDDLYNDHGFDKATMPLCLGGDVAPLCEDAERARYADAVHARLKRRRESMDIVRI